ncbi:phenylalanine--tRNA ligase subunit beta [Vampirovibrio sp.]|uniref:phenylalanine--tRNA ligase subunit beta n=1 Tax=Vampirovibrio sp. TaxID=2717857 RepID=UPI0035935C36
MRVSLEWLNDYVDITGLTPQEIASSLTNSGLEVEGIEYIGPKFNGVVVGKVLSLAPHPNADKLRLVTVSLGATQTQVVCGAPNVREGILIAFAQEGASVISRKDNSLFQLGRAKIRGVESAGMVCSLDELGLETLYEKREDGIWPLDGLASEAQLGQDLKTVLNLQGDVVLEIAPTANRGDQMSMIGVAREVAALFDRTLTLPVWTESKPGGQSEILIQLSDFKVCRYYAGATLSQVKVGAAPDWMSRRLLAAGVRSISNVVDITNYVMLEMGQPLHAFDQAKLTPKGRVDVRYAQDAEKLTTLDDVERVLTPDSVVIAMNDQPVAMAGLMGGASTEMDDQSNSLFLEAAWFEPAAIRKSAKSVGLRSEASARFERGVDIENCRKAMLRAVALLQQHAGAEFTALVESPLPEQVEQSITLHYQRLENILGLSIPTAAIHTILQKLGFGVRESEGQEGVLVSVPSFRQEDVSREIDVIEEVIRIYGYDKVPYTLPQKTGTSMPSLRARMVKSLAEALRGQGLQEVMTTSLIGQTLLDKTGFGVNPDQLVSVLNSHSSDHTLMRQSLLPNILEVAKFNQAQGNEDVWIYELGRTYFKLGKANLKNSGVAERLCLGGLITGSAAVGEWHRKEPADFYLLKGILENLFGHLNLDKQLSFAPVTDVRHLHPGKSASVFLGEKPKEIGWIGELHPEVRKTMKFRHPVYVFELNVETIYKALKQIRQVTQAVEISHFPAMKRDMAFLAPNTLKNNEVLAVLNAVQEPLLRQVELFDEYRSEQLGADKRSLAYRLTFQSSEATMTDADIDQRLNQLKDTLAKQLPVHFR